MMAKNHSNKNSDDAKQNVQLQGGTYEVIRSRLDNCSKQLQQRLNQLNSSRKEVFGSIETKLTASERITTDNNCVPRDMVPVGDSFIFGYNVFIGLRVETTIADVFSVYKYIDGKFAKCPLDIIDDQRFRDDFQKLYKYYRHTTFAKFAVLGPHLFMVFQVGNDIKDIKTFKWLIKNDKLTYLDNRSDHEYVFPAQHEFEWTRVTQDMHHGGSNPHISIEDRIFVETIGGDLTIKIEDNTETGEGIYSEPVENPDQTLNDAEIYYAIVGNIIILKIRPYQEKDFRYFVYNDKIKTALRIDSIRDACVLLPEDHGIIFPKGYYLQVGQQKQFDTDMHDMVYEKRIASPNGEDYLYVFYNHTSGVYVLLSYNIITQQMAIPIVCNGYSYFDDGTLIYFRANGDAQKHHVIQIWQTPFCGPDHGTDVKGDSELFKIGNKSIVRCMAECMELVNLIGKEESYTNLYFDISKKADDIAGSYFWLGDESTFNLAEPITQINDAAASAIEEYEKVVRTRQNTRQQIDQVGSSVKKIITGVDYKTLTDINKFVEHLAQLRAVRGEVVSLRDLRYADNEQIDAFEAQVAENNEKLSGLCVEFLLKPKSLEPYNKSVSKLAAKVPDVKKVSIAKELQTDVAKTAGDLEMLTEIVSNLKIEDATETAAIIDNISLVYSQINKVKAALKNKIKELGAVEGKAEFSAQIKLIEQSVISYLDICDTPDKCEEYLTKATVQLETLESRFADFDEFIIQLSDKREEVYNAFESRKLQLVARRNQRATALMTAAQRVLKGIGNRVKAFKELNEINGYFASDLMIERVRETIDRLNDLGDSVKAEDIKTQLKTLQQDALRQLKDRKALYEDGDNIIRLGTHRFSVNQQALEGTIVQRDGQMYYHLTGTGFFEEITDETILSCRDVWNLDLISEGPDIYRSEYLAKKMLEHIDADHVSDKVLNEDLSAVISRVQTFMAPRFDEGYVKGVHDNDAAIILQAILKLRSRIGLLRYPTRARALATVFWMLFDDHGRKQLITARISAVGRIQDIFAADGIRAGYIDELKDAMTIFAEQTNLFPVSLIDQASEYLFAELTNDTPFVFSKVAADMKNALDIHMDSNKYADHFKEAVAAVSADPAGAFRLMRDLVTAYAADTEHNSLLDYADEVATVLINPNIERAVIDQPVTKTLTGLAGSHNRISKGKYEFDYCDFMLRVEKHEHDIVPRLRGFHKLKKELVEQYAENLRLEEFRPRVLTTFVRNKLIDKVYLPLVGDNLAKQIGTADDKKRTDCQGLLLMISPPGYGKTTLMEYIANRLGLIFMKINGPSIGHSVTSFDPAEATNAAAREEINKLNLAFEMGDNVMIYLDDIQHTNPEFLQKFISLCDAQRRVDGIYNGKSRTYDLRGKRVCVVMAGNPYTESGEKFKIPDMLSNRADTYNIGDIVGDNFNEFVMSYIENCLTSNPVLEKLANRGQHDVYEIIKLASTDRQEDVDFQGNYSVDELNEYVSTMKKLFVVRDVVLKVNQQYIASAGQAEEYRTEPKFLLQGSYRNMNRIAGRVLPVMNDDELWNLIHSSYEQDAQTLTTGAESNLLKFRQLTSRLTDEQSKRWEHITRTFNRNQLLGGDSDDKVGKIIQQLNAFSAGLDSIKDVIADSANAVAVNKTQQKTGSAPEEVKLIGNEVLNKMSDMIAAIKQQEQTIAQQQQTQLSQTEKKNSEMLVSVLEEQFRTMETWLIPVHHGEADRTEYFSHLTQRFEEMVNGYTKLIDALKKKYDPQLAKQLKKKQPKKPRKTNTKTKDQDSNQ
ncbi:MAG: DNA repair ATPase [Anaerohalosphaera sp.]|nr:DNA repair ATPase [Anaerohalosphaera sp.]